MNPSPPRSIALALIRGYQLTLGQLIGGRCRFYPSCSNYAVDAFTLHPPHRAAWLTARRLCRCHPFGGHGVDMVPEGRKGSRDQGIKGSRQAENRADAASS